MPKLKTKKSLAKRIKITKRKKILRSKAGRRHLLSGKTKRCKRNLRKQSGVSKSEKEFIKRGLPYSF